MHCKAKQRMAEAKKLRQYTTRKVTSWRSARRCSWTRSRIRPAISVGKSAGSRVPSPEGATCFDGYASNGRKPCRAKKGPASSSLKIASVPEESEGGHEWDLLVSLCTVNEASPRSSSACACMTLPCGVGPIGGVADHACEGIGHGCHFGHQMLEVGDGRRMDESTPQKVAGRTMNNVGLRSTISGLVAGTCSPVATECSSRWC